MNAARRIKRIYSQMNEQGVDSLLVCLPANITYLTGYPSRDSWLLIAKGKNVYITDPRYGAEAKKCLGRGFSVRQAGGPLTEALAAIAVETKIKKLGLEQKHISAYAYQKITSCLAGITKTIPTIDIVERLREIKSPEEIKKIARAAVIATDALRFIKRHISAGAREIEIAGEIERFIRYKGAEGPSFDIIVASGPNSSYPHHKTSSRKIGRNEPVLIDMGVDYCGYKSDLTMVFFSGRINPLVRKVYDVVAEARNLAIKRVKPGVRTRQVDMAARQYIAEKGYGGLFSHSLGHGVGLEIHESPRLSPREDRIIKKGMVFTIEPAVYLPGEFGIRLEEMVVVTRKGAKILGGTFNK